MKKKKIAIIGSGMSGSSAAYFLAQKGYEVEVLESDTIIGGRTQSLHLEDKVIDIGGKNIGKNYTLFREFVKEYGDHEFEFFGINSTRIKNGELITMDSQKRIRSAYSFLKTVEPLSFAKFLRCALAVKMNPENGYLDSPYFNKLADKCDHQPITKYFKTKFVENILRTITIRMCGTEPDKYYLGCLGSNVKLLIDNFEQLAHGMHYVMEDFQKAHTVRLSTEVKSIVTEKGHVTGVVTETENGVETLNYDGVVLAAPGAVSAKILKSSFPKLTEELEKITYNPVTLAVVRYGRDIFGHAVRALAFDKTTALSNAGCYGVNDRNMIRYTFSGGKAQNEIDETSKPDQVIDLAEKTLNQYVKVSKKIRQDFVYKHFKNGLCSYSPYHYRLLRKIRSLLEKSPGLALSGDYMRGANIEACFKSGLEAAEAIEAKVS